MNNHKFRSLALFSFCLLVILSSSFLIKNIVTERSHNEALVLNAVLPNNKVLLQIDSYTKEAEDLAKSITNKWTLNYFKKKYQAELEEILTQRKALIESALAKGVDLESIKKPTLNLVSIAGEKSLERTVTFKDAIINTFHVDDFKAKKSTYRYEVVANLKRYNLAINPAFGYISGKATISGTVLGSTLYAKVDPSKITKTEADKKFINQNKKESHNTLVLLINFQDTQNAPFTKQQAEGFIFNGQFDKFMKEQSFGAVDFEGDVFGWLTLRKNAGSDGCGLENSFDEIDQFVTENNILLSNYDHYINILNCPTNTSVWGFSTVGKIFTTLGGIFGNASVGTLFLSTSSALAPSQFTSSSVALPYSWTNLDALLAHEMGHALGLPHSHGLDCNEHQVQLPCGNIEYGDTFDAMGSLSGLAFHNNGYYKSLLGWFTPNDILNITQSGTYKLSPVEIPPLNNPSTQPVVKRLALITLPGQSDPVYSVEYRAAVGFDAQLSQGGRAGLYIHKINPSESYLVDSQPTFLEWWSDTERSSLKSPLSFFDTDAGLRIESIVSPSFPNTTLFKVTMTPVPCHSLPPTMQEGIIEYSTPYYYHAEVYNTDTIMCLPSEFVTEIIPDNVFTSTLPSLASNIYPGTIFNAALPFWVTPETPAGTYPLTIKSTNITTGLSSTKVVDYVVQPSGACPALAPFLFANLVTPPEDKISFSVTNTDTNPCPPSDFYTEILPNSILSNADSLSSPNITPGSFFSGLLSFQVIPSTPPGTYNLTVKTRNINSGLYTKTQIPYVVE